jgi:general secretion pathway protein D
MDAGAPDVGPAGYVFDFTDADLPELVRAVSVITGRRIILTGQLPKVKATVHSPDRVTAEEAYQAFLTVLDDNGLTVVRQGAFENVVTKASLLGR